MRHSYLFASGCALVLSFTSSFSTAIDQKIRIACVGDSITAGALSSNREKTSYPAQLQRLLGSAYSVTNFGSSGATLMRTAAAYIKRGPYKRFVAEKWDIVVIMLGTNDMRDKRSGGPQYWNDDCGKAPDFDLERCEFAKAYAELITVARGLGQAPDQPPDIILVIPVPLMKSRANRSNQTAINTVLPLLIPVIARANGLRHEPVSAYAALGGVFDWKARFPDHCVHPRSPWPGCAFFCDSQSCDQCHPNDRGYAALAAAVRLAIDSRSDSPSASASASSSYAVTATPVPTPVDSSIIASASEPELPATRQVDEPRMFGRDATRPPNGALPSESSFGVVIWLTAAFAVVLSVIAIISYRWGRVPVAYEALRSAAASLRKRVAHWRLQ